MPTETQLVADLEVMTAMLADLLTISADATDEPGEPPLDLGSALALIDAAASPLRGSRLFRASAEERRAIETRAVEVTSAHLRGIGYRVRDVGATESYDLHALHRGEVLKVEVKGTVGDGSEVILTRNEVQLHRSFPNSMLAVVSTINLDRETLVASGGTLRTFHPWSPENDLLTPLAFSYQVPVLD